MTTENTAAADPRERVEAYLAQSGLASRSPRVAPLTGDASAPRYFPVLLQGAPPPPRPRDRAEPYPPQSGLASRSPRVVPLTGDASDRRYFRVLLQDASSIVLSLYAAPFDFETLSFVNVARLLTRMPVPIPTITGHAGALGVLALQDLGDVTLQAHLGAATPPEPPAAHRP